MTNPGKRIPPDELMAAAEKPFIRLMIELSRPPGGELIDPKRSEKALLWIRSHHKDDPGYHDQNAMQADLRHLGFFDEEGQLIDDVITTGRLFLDEHWREDANYPRLWRHLNAQQGRISPERTKVDYTVYTNRIAKLLDKETDNLTIGKAVVAMEKEGLDVPTTVLCQADRLNLMRQMLPKTVHANLNQAINERVMDWLPPNAMAHTMRALLKDVHYGLGEHEFEAWLQDQGQPGLVRQLSALFGRRDKRRTLQDLGLLDAGGRWSEIGFQRQLSAVEVFSKTGAQPSLENLRWALHRIYHASEPVPFAWAMFNDLIPEPTLHRARRLASIALSGGMLGEKASVGETITPDQLEHLHRLGAWLHDPLDYQHEPGLRWLGRIARQTNINWKNWTQICSFVFDKLDQVPDRELLKDWQAGVVTFEGKGRHQAQEAQPFSGVTKVGRNDPCPCGFGKKYKKCCGR